MAKYIWFSGATDVTGKALAEALDLTPTKSKPMNLGANDIVIGWGAKTNGAIAMGDTKVLNHPNKIRSNRNKYKSLMKMYDNANLNGSIAKFVASNGILEALENGNNNISLPLVGRTNYHQGGKGFWLCLTKQHVEKAIADGAQYFQTYINIKDEYRLHIVCGEIIYAVKKVENPSKDGWIMQRKEKIQDIAVKNGVQLDEATLNYVLTRISKEVVLPDRIVRSNTRGWKFSSVRLNNVPNTLKNAAIKAVKVMGLDFGAVDCAIGLDDNPYIIEINSAPGLQRTTLTKYIEVFKNKLAEMEAPVVAPRRYPRARGAAVGVGADNVDHNEVENVAVDEEAMVHIMNAVRSPEEARRVLDLMNRG